MTVILLLLIVLILLFGAGVVKGWLKNALGVVLGIALLTGILLTLVSIFGEDAFWTIWVGGGAFLFAFVIWAKSHVPAESEHRARVKRAQQQREERRKKGLN